MLDAMEEPLAPYVLSDKPYTLYSLSSTYICNLIVDGKGIYDVAKLAGHTIAVCEKYYARIDLSNKAKETTDLDSGSRRSRTTEIQRY